MHTYVFWNVLNKAGQQNAAPSRSSAMKLLNLLRLRLKSLTATPKASTPLWLAKVGDVAGWDQGNSFHRLG